MGSVRAFSNIGVGVAPTAVFGARLLPIPPPNTGASSSSGPGSGSATRFLPSPSPGRNPIPLARRKIRTRYRSSYDPQRSLTSSSSKLYSLLPQCLSLSSSAADLPLAHLPRAVSYCDHVAFLCPGPSECRVSASLHR